MFIYAHDYGVLPNEEVAVQLENLLAAVAEIKDEKKIIFDEGDYYIESAKLQSRMLYITNTVGDAEFKNGETPHKNRCALAFCGIENAEFDFCGAEFYINGKATNVAVIDCKNLLIENLKLTPKNPNIRKMTVIAKSLFSVDFKIDGDYYVKNNALYFKGIDYDYNASAKYRFATHLAHIKAKSPKQVWRTGKLFKSAMGVSEIKPGVIRIKYPRTAFCAVGDRFYAFDCLRQYAGIFLDKSENITLQNVHQHFNYSLAYVAQDCKDLTLKSCRFAPKTEDFEIASLADFMQVCMCRGHIDVENNYFDGACDDCANFHGIHFIIESISGNKLTVAFKHPQTHGFNPISEGDEIGYISTKSLLEKGRATVLSSKLTDEYHIELEVNDTSAAAEGFAIEDITKIPTVLFKNNLAKHIITRGLLITVRNKAVVESNRFESCSMSGVLLSDDAANWFESGFCGDVLIKDNVFEFCGEVPVLIKPENKVNEGPVHKNIKIIGNTFNYKGNPVSVKCAENAVVENNK